QKLLALVMALVLALTVAAAGMAETLTGEAEGFGGPIKAEVTVESGAITALTLTGDAETPAIGGAALETLTEAIVAAGGIDGVDGVAGATWTCNGAFAAIKNALGIEEAAEETAVEAVTASGLKHGIGVVGTPRLGPGADANEVPVYSFNEVIAYAIVDSENRIVDLEVDIVEVITPNHDESNEGDNFMAGWPGQSYNSDADGDGVVDGLLEETEEIFTTETLSWLSKRQKGSDYKMNSGTWEQEMDIFESFFVGKTVEEIDAWYAKHCSDVNGRPITAASTKEADVAKFSALTDEEKTVNDAISGATMSLTDAHGDILAAIRKAVANAIPMRDVKSIARIGLGVNVMPRLGPGKDDQDVPCYSFNTSVAAVCYDADGKVVDIYADVLEVITPNHDGADDNAFTGWPGQSYNADVDADGKVDEVWTQTEESFITQISAFQTKRDLGSKYKMNSDTWVGEMTAYEGAMIGKTTEEISAWVAACFSDVNGRALHGTSTKEADIAKYETMTDAQKAEMDAISTATMALRDPHGD
ncbi:MAG: FMN-binding protein, partial [Candidatus Ventricola sp.]